MLRIQIPDNFQPERNYIISVLFKEFLGLEYQVEIADTDKILITNSDEKKISVADHFFSTNPEIWLKHESLPLQPLNVWNLESADIQASTINSLIPVIYGGNPDTEMFFVASENSIELELDILGSSFFMLTRYEEVVKSDRDKLDRFPLIASLAEKSGFLERPIVNEYVEILWSCLHRLWPQLQRKQHEFQIHVSHDLDEPFMFAFTGVSRLLQRCAGDLIRRGSITQMMKTVASWYQVTSGQPELDPYNTFDSIMDISEAHGIKSAFYVIADRSAGSLDGSYTLDHPLIRNLLKKIHKRGHEIGLHTSYNTYRDSLQTKKEFEILQRACEQEGITQSYWGGRQHCLRWQTPVTFQNWEDAGLNYDSTLGYAEKIGFRCGTCYDFPTFNLLSRMRLSLKERPLVVMDATVLRAHYMNLNPASQDTLSKLLLLKRCCIQFDGNFTILWHNPSFANTNERYLYQQLLALN
jgi:peptidoglycan/xylan/chitin deacetylase (PgdA/CDA1 family)